MGLLGSNYCCLGFSCYSISPGGDRKVSYNTPPLLELVESHCCLCLIVTFVSYTSILFKFRFGAHPQRHCAAALRQRKLTVTLFITTLVSLLLSLPCSIVLFLHWSNVIWKPLSLPEHFRLAYSLQFLFYANSLVNPILYTIRMPDFKKALLSLFRRHQRENVAIPLNPYTNREIAQNLISQPYI